MGYRVLEWRNLDVIGFFLYEKSNPKTLQQSHTCATLNCSKVQSKILRKQVRIIQLPIINVVVIIFAFQRVGDSSPKISCGGPLESDLGPPDFGPRNQEPTHLYENLNLGSSDQPYGQLISPICPCNDVCAERRRMEH
jgi:hypothetical protein